MNTVYFRKTVILIIALIIFTGLCGCGDKEEVSSATTQTTYATAPPLLDFDISDLVTVEQVENALGVSVGEAKLADENTTVRYSSDDPLSYIEISIIESSRENFDETVALYEDAEDTLNLGQVAKWSNEYNQLLVYNGKHMISVTAAAAGKSKDALLIAARQIAVFVIEKI